MTKLRLTGLFLSVFLSASCAAPGAWKSDWWSGDTGIAAGVSFGQQSVCTVAWNLAYVGKEPLKAVGAVSVRYPATLAGHGEAARPIGEWTPVSYADSGSSSLATAATYKRLTGSSGVTCPEGPSTLDRLRGTELRIEWETDGGPRDEIVRIDAVRSGTLYQQVDRESGGPDKIEWR